MVLTLIKNEKTPEDRLDIIIKASSLKGPELEDYLRSKDLHLDDLKKWKCDFYNSQVHPTLKCPKVGPELHRLGIKIKQLSNELRRKDEILIELDSRIDLLGKTYETWLRLQNEER